MKINYDGCECQGQDTYIDLKIKKKNPQDSEANYILVIVL